MCGIVGVAGNLLPAHEKVLRTLLILDSLRGEDSTGIVSVGKFAGAEAQIAKQLGNPFQLFDHRSYEDAMRYPSRAIIGHNRYATSGGVSRKTAHPFEAGDLIGVHNGTLTNKGQLLDAYKYSVDSENLYHHIAEKGLDDAIDTAEGAWSLVWWDSSDNTLNFLRNKERPMYIAHSANAKTGDPTNDCIFFASEAWMLEQACWKAGVPYTAPYAIKEDAHISWHVGTGGLLEGPEVRVMPEKKPKVYPFRGQHQQQPANTKPLGVDAGLKTKKERPKLTLAKTIADTVITMPPPSVTGYDKGYIRAKNHSFELLNDAVSAHGEDYIVCSDAAHPYKEVRLYPKKDDDAVWEHVGHWITGDIYGAVQVSNTPGKFFYTINPDSVTLIECEKRVPFGKGSGTVNKQEWDKMGLNCAWCTSPLLFDEANRFTDEMQSFCPCCSEQEDVKELVKFVN